MENSVIIACPICCSLNRIPKQKLTLGGKCGKCKSALQPTTPIEITQHNFSAIVYKSQLPIIVDFWAPWCGPCKMMAPVLEQAVKSLAPTIRVGKLNTETEQSLAAQFSIRSIPTIIKYQDGKEIDRISGALNLSQLSEWAKQSLSTI